MFKASLDNVAKITPVVMIFFCIGFLMVSSFSSGDSLKYIVLFPSIILLVIVFLCYLYQPLGYLIDADSLHIVRRIGKFTIARNTIQKIIPLTTEELGFAWRMAGNGGVFGYTGWYSSGKIGKMRWFVTQRTNYVLVETSKGSKYLLSPDDDARLVKALK